MEIILSEQDTKDAIAVWLAHQGNTRAVVDVQFTTKRAPAATFATITTGEQSISADELLALGQHRRAEILEGFTIPTSAPRSQPAPTPADAGDSGNGNGQDSTAPVVEPSTLPSDAELKDEAVIAQTSSNMFGGAAVVEDEDIPFDADTGDMEPAPLATPQELGADPKPASAPNLFGTPAEPPAAGERALMPGDKPNTVGTEASTETACPAASFTEQVENAAAAKPDPFKAPEVDQVEQAIGLPPSTPADTADTAQPATVAPDPQTKSKVESLFG